jgi:hypothetical protein
MTAARRGHAPPSLFSEVGSFSSSRGSRGARLCNRGRVAQWESACFTRKRSQVQNLPRPPRSPVRPAYEFRLVHYGFCLLEQCASETGPRADVDLRVHVAQVVVDRPTADERLRGDLDAGGSWKASAARPPYAIRGEENRPFAPVWPGPRGARLERTGLYATGRSRPNHSRNHPGRSPRGAGRGSGFLGRTDDPSSSTRAHPSSRNGCPPEARSRRESRR